MEGSQSLFEESFGTRPRVLAHAPGRVEVIGNHLDYNGGPVVGAPIGLGVDTSAGWRDDGNLVLVSRGRTAASLPMKSLLPKGDGAWQDYPAGVVRELVFAGVAGGRGLNLAFDGDLPSGAGLSSSAALEVATARAVLALARSEMPPVDVAVLCRRVENDFVGMPCGILDQGVIACGRHGGLVAIDCHLLAFEDHALPPGSRLWLFPSGAEHRLTDSLYSVRHNECAEALAVLQRSHPGLGALALADAAEVEAARKEMRPEVYRRDCHVTGETLRTRECLRCLANEDLAGAGRCLLESHRSSAELFENSTKELDTLVDLLAETPGVFGARLTGGGFGGAVLALAEEGFDETAGRHVAGRYREASGLESGFFPTGTGEVAVSRVEGGE